jgi:hypothetical protein
LLQLALLLRFLRDLSCRCFKRPCRHAKRASGPYAQCIGDSCAKRAGADRARRGAVNAGADNEHTLLATDLGEIMLGADAVDIAKARQRAKRTWPIVLGFLVGCGIGASWEAKIELFALILPAGFALLALALAMDRQPGKSGD